MYKRDYTEYLTMRCSETRCMSYFSSVEPIDICVLYLQ